MLGVLLLTSSNKIVIFRSAKENIQTDPITWHEERDQLKDQERNGANKFCS